MSVDTGQPASPFSSESAVAWVAEMFEEPPGTLQADTPRTAIPGWDSLGQLVLMSKLDERFGIRLTENELSRLQSVDDILEVLRQHGHLATD